MPTSTSTRKPYRRADYLFLVANYRHHSAPTLAAQLGRTTGSLYRFISRYPELRKQERIKPKINLEIKFAYISFDAVNNYNLFTDY